MLPGGHNLTLAMSLSSPYWVLGLGVALVGFAAGAWVVRRCAPPAPTITPAEQAERTRQTRGLQRDLEELMLEIEQLTRRLESRLENKSARLEALIVEADRRLAELRQVPSRDAAIDTTADAPRMRIAPQPAAEEPEDPLARSVYQLADAGHPPIDIARRLKEQIGKIELILALRQVG